MLPGFNALPGWSRQSRRVIACAALLLGACSGGQTDSSTSTPAPSPGTGSAVATWVAPTTRVDGSAITLGEVGGYRVYFGTSPDPVTTVVNLPGAGSTEYRVSNLGPGTYYFRVSVYDSDGIEGPKSVVASKSIP